ncbi:MAG: hypothetical protein ACFFBF_15070 [Promethearchaeota archaeon]
MNKNDLYKILHKKSIKQDNELIANRNKKLINMNPQECTKYLRQKINSFEENMLREKKKGDLSVSFYLNNIVELYKNLYNRLIFEPNFINEFKETITNEEMFGKKLREIEINNMLKMDHAQFVRIHQEYIQIIQEILEKESKFKYWSFPINREHLEKELLEEKDILSKLEKNPNYINKIKESLKNQLNY